MSSIQNSKKSTKRKYIKLIKLAYKRKSFDAALGHCKRFAKAHPREWEAYYYLASTYTYKDQEPLTEAILREGISNATNNITLLLSLAKILEKRKDNAQALTVYNQTIKEHPTSWKGYVHASNLLIKLRKIEDARIIVEQGLASCPAKMNILKSASSIYRALGRRKDSLSICLCFIIHYKSSHIGYLRSSEDFQILGNHKDAKEILIKGIASVPTKKATFLTRYLDILDDHYQRQEYDLLKKEAEFLRLHYPDFWHGHALSIRMAVLEEDFSAATNFLLHAETLFPGNKHILNLHGELYAKSNEYDKCKVVDHDYTALSARTTKKENLHSPASHAEIEAQILNCFRQERPAYFTDLGGNNSFIPPQHATELNDNLARIIFDIFEHASLEYFLFAGSMVGYLRERNIPVWADDIDVMIFNDHLPTFTDAVMPSLMQLGFSITPVRAVRGEVGGYQIRFSPTKIQALYDDSTQIKIWPFQLDVFVTAESCLGYARNVKKWGLYHEKDVPVRWIRPSTKVRLFGRDVPVFREYERDILHEYGNVYSNIVISSHINQGTTFLQAFDLSWESFGRIFKHHYYLKATCLPPIISEFISGKHEVRHQAMIDDTSAKSFSDLCHLVLSACPELLILTKITSFIWLIDLKRIFPSLRVRACLDNIKQINLIIIMLKYLDEVDFGDESVAAAYQENVELLKFFNNHSDAHISYSPRHNQTPNPFP